MTFVCYDDPSKRFRTVDECVDYLYDCFMGSVTDGTSKYELEDGLNDWLSDHDWTAQDMLQCALAGDRDTPEVLLMHYLNDAVRFHFKEEESE